MLTDNEKKIFQEKIKEVTSTNKKITILLNEKLQHDLKNKEYKSNEFFFDYLKKEVKPKRKMGHLTTLEA